MATADLLTPLPAAPRRDPSPRLWTVAEFARMLQLGLFAGRDVELIEGTVMERAGGSVRPFVFTRKEYYALNDNQFFLTEFYDTQRVQLIGGVILVESPMNTPHAVGVRLVTKAVEKVFTDGYDVRAQLPLNLDPLSEPHPDIAVVTGSPRDYLAEHPKTALLVIEVSDTTLDADTHTKADLYAASGIADYWVVDLVNDRVIVFRDPRPNAKSAFGHTYALPTICTRDDHLTPLAAPQSRITAGDLLP